MAQKLLTIGIPTYNRKECLRNCLLALMPQVKNYTEKITVLVSDNASTEDNYEVINEFLKNGFEIEYFKHSENLGMDGNFISIYEKAQTKYVWQLSDDDILVENGLRRVMDILMTYSDIGALYIENKWFNNEIDYSKFDLSCESELTIYNEPIEYIKRVNYWVTFISAHIVNKNLLYNKINASEFKGTFLALLSWTIPSCFQGNGSIVLEVPILACRAKGQGGYKFVKVFAKNMNYVLKEIIKKGYPYKIRSTINYYLLKDYFSQFIIAKRDGGLQKSSNYFQENWFWSFFKVYYSNIYYYIFLLPSFFLPNSLYNKYIFRAKKMF